MANRGLAAPTRRLSLLGEDDEEGANPEPVEGLGDRRLPNLEA